MLEKLLVLSLAVVLAMGLAGCGTNEEAAPTGETTQTVKIADERIVGKWTGADGDVEFRDDGIAVLADGSEIPFEMPTSDRLFFDFPDAGRQTFQISWENDDRHGVLASSSTTTVPTWYDRQK
jgi:hypothetical protein